MDQRTRFSDVERKVVEQAQAVPQWATEMVDAQPLASLLTVFAAGFVVGAGVVAAVVTAPPPRTRLQEAELYKDRIVEAIAKSMPKQLSDLWAR
ncbi:hypothetical protein [Planctomicrobium piriforme]|uniref:Uncharacterized protein n=1 Tax=Planctomicrobium piriforme TaxID=1576369 RepID=A0A1I3KWC3_9PLAN|nr:hypothetical protein [Planctomicrobium piriforme]SFI76628.1 hypothetical protein SAMN05421753_11260 [Planctomicrobium piriforme]